MAGVTPSLNYSIEWREKLYLEDQEPYEQSFLDYDKNSKRISCTCISNSNLISIDHITLKFVKILKHKNFQ
jgi:hypothetical protein